MIGFVSGVVQWRTTRYSALRSTDRTLTVGRPVAGCRSTRPPNAALRGCRLQADRAPAPLDQERERPESPAFGADSLPVVLAALAAFVQADAAMAAAEPTSDSTLKALFKSVPLSLVHPITMGVLLVATSFVFYLGYQARQLRTTTDGEVKRRLASQRPGQKHHQLAGVILAVMTITTFEGMGNTFARTGKLFPGPHLYAGLTLVALMSSMASLAPFMLRGNVAARNAHFLMAFGVLGTFAWQLQSGLEIVAKLLGLK
ncbi:hypothetical protein CDCA_CDCA05G1662 [Cyanidium caldarium]|uniref:DUF4079 domain-containing protein n=1 Tax=Cyanidium caldarium TaxID=2771 RepID=A0AAV9ITI0_CYACA|nr:hypothetical protein CDCA_CDCA05G1662 [Cyanidium caldarium]|eukprot:ctg_1112.g355